MCIGNTMMRNKLLPLKMRGISTIPSLVAGQGGESHHSTNKVAKSTKVQTRWRKAPKYKQVTSLTIWLVLIGKGVLLFMGKRNWRTWITFMFEVFNSHCNSLLQHHASREFSPMCVSKHLAIAINN